MRRPLVVGNWKMNGSLRGNRDLLEKLVQLWVSTEETEVAVCPPFVYLDAAGELLSGSVIKLGAQDVSRQKSGAYTGEISASMLQELGCGFVIVGHSERREYHSESSELVAQKAQAALDAGLTPIVCVGETLQQREAGSTLAVVGEQLQALISHLDAGSLAEVVVAYEPVWAIGTGLTASPEQAQEVHAFIRQQLGAVAGAIRVLYGGSVKPENASELFAQADIDGALVGGASLKSEDFYRICKTAAERC